MGEAKRGRAAQLRARYAARERAVETAPVTTSVPRVPRQPRTTAALERARTAKEHRAQEHQRQEVLDYLASLQETRAIVEQQITDHIAKATQLGVTRVDIAAALGISRQAVQQRLSALG